MGRPMGPGAPTHRAGRVHLRIELLEDRSTPAAVVIGGDVYYPTVVAGDPIGIPADSPDQRIDPNTKDSPFAGVGSIQVTSRHGPSIGTGTLIGSRYVLTAAHVMDLNNDGKVDRNDHTTGTYFILNFGGNRTARIAVSRITIHPDFDGFGNPSVNDDIAILKLARDVPAGVPTYALPDGAITQGMVLKFVGYGRSGDGITGYNTSASFSVKRVGENTADAFFGQDDAGRPEADEVFRYDFDGPEGDGPMGGPSLGNNRETTIGAGDSGGPAFAESEGGMTLMGMVTFIQGASAPKFGSLGGGVNLFWYLSFINSVLHPGTGGGLVLPGEPSAGGGGLVHDAVAARFTSEILPSWSADESSLPVDLPSYSASTDDDPDRPVVSPPADRSPTSPPPAVWVDLYAEELLAFGSLLSADSGLVSLATGGATIASDE